MLHPFTFDTKDVPTDITSVTFARKLRIDAIVYQSQRLELLDVQETPRETFLEPIPNAYHPSETWIYQRTLALLPRITCPSWRASAVGHNALGFARMPRNGSGPWQARKPRCR